MAKTKLKKDFFQGYAAVIDKLAEESIAADRKWNKDNPPDLEIIESDLTPDRRTIGIWNVPGGVYYGFKTMSKTAPYKCQSLIFVSNELINGIAKIKKQK